MKERIKRKVRVTTVKEIEVELDASLATEEMLAQWRKGLWHVDGIDDIAKYAARMVANGMDGYENDGIFKLVPSCSRERARSFDTIFTILSEECEDEEEVMEGN